MAARRKARAATRPVMALGLTVVALAATLGAGSTIPGAPPSAAASSAPATPATAPGSVQAMAAAPGRPRVEVRGASGAARAAKGPESKVEPALRGPTPAQNAPTQDAPTQDGPAQDGPATRSTAPSTVDVELLVTASGFDAATAAVRSSGGRVTGEVPGSLVQAKVPVSALDALAAVPGVEMVRRPVDINIVPQQDLGQAGAAGSEPVAKTLANQWHAAGINGAGITVGIIDVFDQATWNQAAASGDLPGGTPISFCRASGSACSVFSAGSRHGTAVAEIVHDMAPAAGLRLVSVQTTSDLRAAIDWLAGQGVTVVNRSQGAPFDGPGNGTGPLADVAAYAASRGITFFNSAGNAGGGAYWRGSWVDSDGDGFLNFSGADELLGVSVNGCGVALGFRWSDWGPVAGRTDYDVYVDNGDGVINGNDAGWEANQQAGAPPVEMAAGLLGTCDGVARVVNIAVRLYNRGSGTAGDVLELMMNGNPLEYWSAPFSGTQPVSDSANPGVVSVGAIDPWNGPAAAYYSSQGPTNDGRPKPDLSAPSCFSTVAFGSSCFNGTSAASPVAAGAGALVRQAGRAVDASTVRAFLTSSALDRGAPGVDNVTGWGEVRLPPLISTRSGPGRFVPVAPFRLFDTRLGQGEPAGRVAPGNVVKAQVLGKGGVPASGVSAVFVNVTMAGATYPGYAQVYPHAAATIGGSSNLNVDAVGQTVAGLTAVPVGLDGRIAIYDQAGSEVIVDVFGYVAETASSRAGRYQALQPSRILDTRHAGGKLTVGNSRTVPVAGRGGVPANGATAVVVNLTATQSDGPGFFQVLPGQSGAIWGWSNLNLSRANQTVANLVVVPVDASGNIRLYAQATSHLIVDVMGWFTGDGAAASSSGLFTPVGPVRLRDTRATGGPVPPGGTVTIDPRTSPSLAGANPSAVFLTVTATGALAPGYVQVYPSGAPAGLVSSNLNLDFTGQTVPNAVVATLGAGRQFTIFTDRGTHLIADIAGWFSA